MTERERPSADFEVGAIYFPSWHAEPRWEERKGLGFTEWDLIRAGRPRFPGHYQPIMPTGGYKDETDPDHMQESCNMAHAAGVSAFLWDWYWYEGSDFLVRPLNETYMKLRHPGVKFALMWANHDWVDAFPAHPGKPMDLWWKGALTAQEFTRMTEVIIDRYLLHPNYWRPNNRAWFTIFRLDEFIRGSGGLATATKLLDGFRERADTRGAGALHLNAMGGYAGYTGAQIKDLGLDSLGTYGWTAQWEDQMPNALTYDYSVWRDRAKLNWYEERERQLIEVVPTVAMGWDSSTRVAQDAVLEVSSQWPYFPIVVDGTPELFGGAVRDAIKFTKHHTTTKVLFINAWNEWTEGSYLEPASLYGDNYLSELTGVLREARADGIE